VDGLRKHFESNMFGQLAVTQAFLHAMIRRRSGVIINSERGVGGGMERVARWMEGWLWLCLFAL